MIKKIQKILINILLLTSIVFPQSDSPSGEPQFIEQALKERSDIVFYGGFEGDFNNDAWKKTWGIAWENRADAAEIFEEGEAFIGNHTIRVSYPKGAVGPGQGGMQFPIKFQNIDGMPQHLFDSLYLRYYVKFEEGFDFKLGGKLPGLMGGENSYDRSGGNQPDGTNGWTMRCMWRPNGEAVVYAYLPPSKHMHGDWGADIKINKFFVPGKWHCIEQFVKINTPGKEDGKLYVWFDGEECISLNDVTYLTEMNNWGKIGGIFFSSFHGGHTPEWGPTVDSYIQYDGFAAGLKRIGLVDSKDEVPVKK